MKTERHISLAHFTFVLTKSYILFFFQPVWKLHPCFVSSDWQYYSSFYFFFARSVGKLISFVPARPARKITSLLATPPVGINLSFCRLLLQCQLDAHTDEEQNNLNKSSTISDPGNWIFPMSDSQHCSVVQNCPQTELEINDESYPKDDNRRHFSNFVMQGN